MEAKDKSAINGKKKKKRIKVLVPVDSIASGR